MLAELIRTQTDVAPLELIARVVLECKESTTNVANAIFAPMTNS